MAKIPELRSQYIWLVCLILYLIPIIHPIGAPFQISDITKKIYNYIENLPEGSIIVMGGSGVFAFDFEPGAAMIACIKQMARNKLRLVAFPLGVESLQFHKFCVDAAKVLEKDGGPWKYGIDFVQLPYVPGYDAALISFLNDVHGTVKVDAYGTPIEELPLMQDLHDYRDIALWICPHWSFPLIVRFVTGEKGIPSVMFAHSYSYSVFAPYMMIYPDKVWMTNGFLGGAQYEKLVGIKGLGHAAVDSYAIISAAYIIFVVLGNLTMLTRARRGEEEEVAA
ncbi:MAG: hypothetical protein DRP27_10345 [Thermotogae bacterium]|nr:MAG: hypothetical protein DRP27_10345 [Thermotogota bacterium]